MSVSRLFTSIDSVWVLLALLVPFLVAATNPLQDDIWWTLKLGELLASGHALHQEVLTFPPHAEGYVNAQWLTQRWYYEVHQALGLEGVPLVNALQLTAAFALVLDLARRRSGDMRVAALATMLGTVIAATNFNPRAQTLAALLFAATAWLLLSAFPVIASGGPSALGARPAKQEPYSTRSADQNSAKRVVTWEGPSSRRRVLLRLAALTALAALWANVHGSFWLGPALALILFPGRPTAFLPLAALAQCFGALVNPHGARIYHYVTTILTHSVVRDAITEWQPPAVTDLSGGAFYCSLVITAALVLWRRRWREALPLLLFATLGLLAVRNLIWWGLAAPPLWAACLAPFPQRRLAVPRPALNAALIAVLLMIALWSVPWTKGLNPLLPGSRRPLISPELPVAAADSLAAAGIGGRVFAFQPWGGYLEWRLWPHHQLMVDGRIELRPPNVWDDYASISAGDPTWPQRVEPYRIDVLVVSVAHQAGLIGAVQDNPAWQRINDDGVALIYLRR